MDQARISLIVFLLITVISLPLMTAHAIQPGVPGFAEITNPAPDQPVDGLITIEGTAFHPDFKAYELFFSYDPNPTGTWFPLAESIDTPVQEEGLALWDTSNITPGTYQLRLQVTSSQGQTIEAIVGGLLVGEGASLPAEAPVQSDPVDQAEALDESAAELPAPAASGQSEEAAPQSPEETLWRLLLSGALAAGLLLIGFGGYSVLRPRVRDYLGLLQMRRTYRDQRRSDRDRPNQR